MSQSNNVDDADDDEVTVTNMIALMAIVEEEERSRQAAIPFLGAVIADDDLALLKASLAGHDIPATPEESMLMRLASGPQAQFAKAAATPMQRLALLCEFCLALTTVKVAFVPHINSDKYDDPRYLDQEQIRRGAAVSALLKFGSVPASAEQVPVMFTMLILANTIFMEAGPLVELAERHVADVGRRRDDIAILSLLAYHLWRIANKQITPEVQRAVDLLGGWTLEVPVEPWPLAVNDWLASQSTEHRDAWFGLLNYARTQSGARPKPAWLKTGAAHVNAVGAATFANAMGQWSHILGTLPAEYPQGQSAHPTICFNDHLIKGLCWLMTLQPTPVTVKVLRDYIRRGGVGTGNGLVAQGAVSGGVEALRMMATPESIAALVELKARMRKPAVLKLVSRALELLTEEWGSYYEFVELSAETFDLNAAGVREVQVGNDTARIVLSSAGKVELLWLAAGGATTRTVPAAAKDDHGGEVKDLKEIVKELELSVRIRRATLEAMLRVDRSWSVATWRARYFDHPVVGVHAHRLIWRVETGGVPGASFIACDGRLVDAAGHDVALPAEATIRLWHPALAGDDEIAAWRLWIAERELVQPFKQAFREVYRLTDAERGTEDHSNRFAAHIVRQALYRGVTEARGWKFQTIRTHGDFNPAASLTMPDVPYCAEFVVAPVTSDTDELEHTWLTTDYLRFLSTGRNARPVLLADVPPLVFSEVMRDVDLFVSVSSVASDPTWTPGGPHRYYREHYDSEQLASGADVRRAALALLLPKLKIAKQCVLEDRHLVVTGKRHTYSIHLASGNVHISKSGRYLCIVASGAAALPKIWLPFDDDVRLAEILSKAFLLAADNRITDPEILRQMG